MRNKEEFKALVEKHVAAQRKADADAARRRKMILSGVTALVLCIAVALPLCLPAVRPTDTDDASMDGAALTKQEAFWDKKPIITFPCEMSPDFEPDIPADLSDIFADNLAMGYTREEIAERAADEAFRKAYMDFAVKIFQGADDIKTEDNICFSPLSAMLALAMTANGADGKTLAEMEALLCGDLSIDELNATLRTWVDRMLSRQFKESTFRVANSIWVKKGIFIPDPAFLQTNANYYGAEVYAAPFDDSTVDDMNLWIKQHTNGLIEKMIDEISPQTVMYLINTLYLKSVWWTPYLDNQVSEGVFHGTESDVTATMLSSREPCYLSMDGAKGFQKSMYGYTLVALLPDEGTDAGEFIASLTGEKLQAFLDSKSEADVRVEMPAFSYDSSIDLTQVLQSYIPTATGDGADFSKMGETVSGNTLFIGKVQQDISITLNKNGISAAAGTVVDMEEEGGIPPFDVSIYYITLNRPFVYVILDDLTGLPVMMGVVEQI
ncbi:MAG: serpin family protein [Eubacteriales bacterium]